MNRFVSMVLFLVLITCIVFSQQRRGKEVTIAGEVIDMQCYISGTMGKGVGAEHKDCATDCAKGGIPLAILEDKTGTIYVAGQTKSSMEGANELLIPYVAQKVKVTGRLQEKSGIRFLLINKISKQSEK